jgi:ATP-dependent Clp protease ATP-binding subunit ClpA
MSEDAALARRFQPVYVSSRTSNTISILRGLKTIRAASRRAHCHSVIVVPRRCRIVITDRFLPDKAINLIDEAAARLKMQVDSKPEELID